MGQPLYYVTEIQTSSAPRKHKRPACKLRGEIIGLLTAVQGGHAQFPGGNGRTLKAQTGERHDQVLQSVRITHSFWTCRFWICEFACLLKFIHNLNINTVIICGHVQGGENLSFPGHMFPLVPLLCAQLLPWLSGDLLAWMERPLFAVGPVESSSQASSEACRGRTAETLCF